MRGKITDRVAIVGMGCSKFGERWDKDVIDLTVEAAYEAYEDAGIEPQDIQAAWYGTTLLRRGTPLCEALKFQYIPVTRVENACATATDALRNASYAVAAGMYDMVMAIGTEKLKDQGFTGLAPYQPPSSEVLPPTPPPTQFALAATRYAHHYGYDMGELKRILARIDVKNHHNGNLNPKAHLRREVTIEQVLSAPWVSWPLGLFDCCGVSDGSACAIITTPEIAKTLKHKDDYILIKSLALACGGKQGRLLDWYDFVHFDENILVYRYLPI